MADKKFPGLWIETGEDGKISVVMSDGNDQVYSLPPVAPAEDLIATAELDYAAYRREIQRLYEEHPLFDEQLDVSTADLNDFVAEALMLPSMLQEIDPLSFWELGYLLDQALQMRHFSFTREGSCFGFWRYPSAHSSVSATSWK